MILRLTGHFGVDSLDGLRAGFDCITSRVTIDLEQANLAACALGEIMALANRIGIPNVELVNPNPMMRKILSITQLDRVLHVGYSEDAGARYAQIA